MAPLYMNPISAGDPPRDASADEQQCNSVRVDSPLESRRPVPRKDEIQGDKDQSLAIRQRNTMPGDKSSRSADSGGSLRFFVVGHPDELRDREQMRENRKHVMYDYLEKERHRPDSTDSRVTGSTQARKRKRMEIVLPRTSTNPAAPSNFFLDPARLTPASSVYSNTSSNGSVDRAKSHSSAEGTARPEYASRQKISIGSQALMRRDARTRSSSELPLVDGLGGIFRNSRYLANTPEEIPFPVTHLGGKLNPFSTWPMFVDPLVDVNELKYNCSRRFGSRAISRLWVPTLLRARHAFLSTICISSAHDDIMSRAAKPPHLRPQHESFERARVRSEVTQMVQECLRDPDMATADATIVTVLHLLNSEIMGCNDSTMRTHQAGLHSMVQERGGLHRLGVNGHLASISTITMYLIAALREAPPHQDFVAFAMKQKTKAPDNSEPSELLPESPVYSRPRGFCTITKAVAPGSPIFEVLDDMRKLTNTFLASHGQASLSIKASQQSSWRDRSQIEIAALREKVFALEHCEKLDFPSMSDRYTYEAIRLTSQIYAHALTKKIPLSEAAAALRASTATPFPVGFHVSDPSTIGLQESLTVKEGSPMHVYIKTALQRTDTSDCWGHMAGVLFWISVVAGAAANPGMLDEEDRVGEEEDARKWLAAVAVRCSIVLSFDYGKAMLETLKRTVAIEEVLLKWKEDDLWKEVIAGVAGAYGPRESVPVVQRGFADYAVDFLTT